MSNVTRLSPRDQARSGRIQNITAASRMVTGWRLELLERVAKALGTDEELEVMGALRNDDTDIVIQYIRGVMDDHRIATGLPAI